MKIVRRNTIKFEKISKQLKVNKQNMSSQDIDHLTLEQEKMKNKFLKEYGSIETFYEIQN